MLNSGQKMWSNRDHHNKKILQKVFGPDKGSSKRQTIAAANVVVVVFAAATAAAIVHWNKAKEII